MNIAVYSHYFTPEIGAPSARIYDLAQQWLRAGHQVEVVTCLPNHPSGVLYPGYRSTHYLQEYVDGIRVHRHWTYITPNKGFFKKTLGHLSYWPSARLFSDAKLSRPDVVIGSSPTFFAAMAAARKARQVRAPFIMEVRDLWPAAFVELGVLRNPLLIRLLEMWELSLYRRADNIVTVTSAFKENLSARQVPTDKLTVIPNGADDEFWRPTDASESLRRKLGLDGKFVVLYIGAHGISQALSRILDSAKLLAGNSSIRFLFVGDGAEKEKLIQRAGTLSLTNVAFLDPVDKDLVKSYYALADICLVPLRDIPLFKTFIPSKMFEMLAMAKPILASLDGEAAEILRQSGGAVVVPPEDSNAIAAALLRLSLDPAQLLPMGRRGREFVVENYSRRSLAKKYIDMIQPVVQKFAREAR